MAQDSFSIVILAAGKATRFKSAHPKVLHRLAGRPLGEYAIRAALAAKPEKVYAVIGREASAVRRTYEHFPVEFIEQKEQMGTGHALMVARKELERCSSPSVIVLVGDAPLIQAETLGQLLAIHLMSKAAATVLTTRLENPHGYGRIVRGKGNLVRSIIEQKLATAAQAKIKEINSGILCFAREKLLDHLDELSADNTQKEYLLTDLVRIFNRRREKVIAYLAPDSREVLGVNDRVELAQIEKILRLRKAEALMREGVSITDPAATYIDEDVGAGPDTVIEPGVTLRGRTRIGRDCTIHANSTISDSSLGDHVTIRQGCVISGCTISSDAVIGPFAHLREGATIEEEARIGNFVEVKKSRVGRGTKSLHLTYLGDATLGEKVNVGAGTVTCNYDGEKKHPTIIEEGVFIGSGSMLVAPVRIGRGSYVAAGSTITEDVPPKSLAIGRAPQVNKEGWIESRARTKPASAVDAAEITQTVFVSFRKIGEITVLDLPAKVTYGIPAQDIGKQFQDAIAAGQKDVVVNLQEVEYVDSAGLGVLAAALITARRVGGNVKLACTSDKVMKIVEAANLHRAFEMFDTEKAAIESFEKKDSD